MQPQRAEQAAPAEADHLRVALAVVTRERDEARAMIEGRAVAPTDAEIAAHHAARGAWVILCEDGVSLTIERCSLGLIRGHRARGARRWWAVDAQGRLCPWPEVVVRAFEEREGLWRAELAVPGLAASVTGPSECAARERLDDVLRRGTTR